MPYLFNNLYFWLPCIGVITAGVAMGLGSHTSSLGLLWLVALFPLFVVFDCICQNSRFSWRQKAIWTFLACWVAGCIASAWAASFMTHSIHVFGHLPKVVAVLITVFGYGLEVTLLLFVVFAVPLLWIRRWHGWDIVMRFAFFVMVEPIYPKLFPWSIGKFSFLEVSWIAQTADLLGAWGLGFYVGGCNFLLLFFWRWFRQSQGLSTYSINKKLACCFSGIYLVLLVSGMAYGGWRTYQLRPLLSQGPSLHVAAIQPNFSLQRLASNPELAYSKRKNNIYELLNDSAIALMPFSNSSFQADSSIPKLVVWPESVYPFDAKNKEGLRLLEQFAKSQQSAILSTSVDWELTAEGDPLWYSISFLMGADGTVKGRYNKISLIPFGEYIPGAEWFPAYRRWLKKLVPNISEFERGKEFTVFQLSDSIRLSGIICYDAFSAEIIRNMVHNGAGLIVNLSNLAWFGRTNASRQMESILRWHAIENRVPFLYISNNGESVFLNSLGEPMSQRLELFEQGSLSETIHLQQHYSIYREHREWIQGGIVLLFLIILLSGHKYGRIFTINSDT